MNKPLLSYQQALIIIYSSILLVVINRDQSTRAQLPNNLSLLHRFHVPQSIVQVVAIFYSDSLVLLSTARDREREEIINNFPKFTHQSTYMSSVDRTVSPMASAVSLPSAMIATTVPLSTSVICAPGDVRPGHIIFAPLNTNRMAPLSTCCLGRKTGYLWNNRSVGIHGPSRCRKNNCSPCEAIITSMCSWLEGERKSALKDEEKKEGQVRTLTI